MIAHGQILNAGVMIQPFKMIGGIESTMATNHFGESQPVQCFHNRSAPRGVSCTLRGVVHTRSPPRGVSSQHARSADSVMIQPFKMIGGIESTMATNHFGESQPYLT